MVVRTRFAPSPTGYLHIGGARTALFSWLFSRNKGGKFVLRIEDTDRERSTADSVQAIIDGLAWLGLDYDEGPFHQTQRFDRYREVQEQLLAEDKAYFCYCSKERLQALREGQMANKQKPRYDGRCRHRREPPPEGVAPVVRFKNPLDGQVVVDDIIRGRVPFNNAELDDLIIARADGTPTYNFTVVVDDHDMGITHVIRGDDHLNNTPRQINILWALEAPVPAYGHVPMILGADGKRLSKRHGAVSVMQYYDEGYLPEALLNYLVRLGWSYGDQEIFSRQEMIDLFEVEKVNKAASVFNPEKLLWLNQHYIKNGATGRLAELLEEYLRRLGVQVCETPALTAVVECQRERSKTMVEMAQNSAFFYREFEDYEEKAARKALTPVAKAPLTKLGEALEGLGTWQANQIHQKINLVAEAMELKLGKVAQPLRVAVAGQGISPPIDITLELLGKEPTLARIERALAYVNAQGQSGVAAPS